MKTKNLQRVTMLVLIVLSSFTLSCKSDDDGGGGGGSAAEGTISAKVDGQQFNSLSMSTTGVLINAGGSKTVSILGTNVDGKAISIVVNGFTDEGTYQIGGGANVSISASYIETNLLNPSNSQTWQAPYDDSIAGEISFSSVSETNVKGTFHFKCKNVLNGGGMKDITDGSFNINLTSQ